MASLRKPFNSRDKLGDSLGNQFLWSCILLVQVCSVLFPEASLVLRKLIWDNSVKTVLYDLSLFTQGSVAHGSHGR